MIINVFLPCYNEEKNIGILIDQWIAQTKILDDAGYQLKVYAIDDCSTDNTKKIITDKVEEYGKVVNLIEHKENKNLSGGLNTSIATFLNIGEEGDLMCLMDGDATHSPIYIHNMFAKMIESKKDCIIASRYCKDSNVVGLAFYRKILSDFARIYYSCILRVPGVKDYTCGYRLYNYSCVSSLAEKFGPDPIKVKSFACMMEFLYKIYLSGGTFGETGFELRYDLKQGESKMRVGSTIKNSLSTALRLKKMRK